MSLVPFSDSMRQQFWLCRSDRGISVQRQFQSHWNMADECEVPNITG